MVDVTMPTGTKTRNGLVYTPTLMQDFTTPAAIGAVRSAYPSMGYYDGFTDTSGNGLYAPDKVLSVHDSYLDIYLHSEAGQPLISAIMPDNYAPTTYGRYDIRFKVTSGATGYKFVPLMWPSSDNWDDGEIDWPEADLGGIPRPASASTPPSYKADGVSRYFYPGSDFPAPTNMLDWHVASTEWTPTAINFYWDDVLITSITATQGIPTKPMRLTLQAETWIGEGATPTTSSDHILVDWVVKYGAPVSAAGPAAKLRVSKITGFANTDNAKLRISSVSGFATPVNTLGSAKLRISSLIGYSLSVDPGARLRVSDITGYAVAKTPSTTAKLRISSISGFAVQKTGTAKLQISSITGSTLALAKIPDIVNIEPYDIVSISAKPLAVVANATYVWRQISGAAVILSGSGETMAFVAPATFAGGDIVLGITMSSNGSAFPEQTVKITVYPHTVFRKSGSTIVPLRIEDKSLVLSDPIDGFNPES